MDLNNTAVGTEKEPSEMTRQGIRRMEAGKGSKNSHARAFKMASGFAYGISHAF